MTQLCFTTFLVSYLKLELGRSLAAAALVLAVSQVLSVACRVLWGQVADRWVSPLRLLFAPLHFLNLTLPGAAAALTRLCYRIDTAFREGERGHLLGRVRRRN